jgi:hypothetical protein
LNTTKFCRHIAYILEIVSANFHAFLCPLSGVVDVRVIARIFGGAHGPHFVACRPGPQGDKGSNEMRIMDDPMRMLVGLALKREAASERRISYR